MVAEHWGLLPQLLVMAKVAVPAYEFFVTLGLVLGLGVCFWGVRRQTRLAESSMLYIVAVAVLGGALGAKIPVWLLNFPKPRTAFPSLEALLSGRTILGGIIGGTLAVNWFKKNAGITGKFGNPIAPGLALGMAVGRLGCLCKGCCYGRPTHAAWGFDFGDHILRHPTQLYDGLFNLLLFVYLLTLRKNDPAPGRLFQIYVSAYLGFRFLVEFVREEPTVWLGMTAAQMAILALFGYWLLRHYGRQVKRTPETEGH